MARVQASTGHFVWTKEDEQRQEKARRAARRHTLLVKTLRFLLPASGLLIVAAMVGFIIFKSILSGLGLGEVSFSTDGLVMSNPHLSGTDGERSYSISADRAIQRLSNPQIIDLDNIVGQIALDKSDSAKITATNGTYNMGEETLLLDGGITVDYSKGYKATFEFLDIDMKTGKILTSDRVDVQSDGGMIDAGSMSFDQENGILNFSGGVSMVLNPASMEKKQ